MRVYNYTIHEGSVEMKTQEEELPKKLQRADVRTTGPSQRADIRPPLDNLHIYTRAKSAKDGRHRMTGDRTTASYRKSGATSTEPK